MIAALLVFGVLLIGAALFGARASAALSPPAIRFTLLGLGTACLLAAGTSAVLTVVRTPAQPSAAAPSTQAARPPRVMIVGDDGPEGAIPRTDPAFQS